MFTPAISPVDPRLMMVNCDMSAAYTSEDGGHAWRMIHCTQLRSSTRCRPAFHPSDRGTVYAADGWSGLKVSRDGGVHWQATGKGLPGGLVGEIAIDAGQPARMLVGAGDGVWRSDDAGSTWQRCDGPRGQAIAFHFDTTSPAGQRVCFAATDAGIWRSKDGGAAWQPCVSGLPAGKVLGFAGGSNAGEGGTILYCTVPGVAVDGRYAGGVYRSTDRGATWQPAMGTGLNVDTRAFDEWAMGPIAQYQRVVTTDARPRTVYVFNSNTGIPPPHHATAFRSDDAGATWRATFFPDPRYPGCNVAPDYTVVEDGQFYQDVPEVAIDAQDPDRLLIVDSGCAHVTDNGGKTWFCGHTRPAGQGPVQKGCRWQCTGLVVTTTWNYYVDPFRPANHYICYTDIGFARSEDRGASWQWWPAAGRPPWRNTCYELAFDPDIPGKVWGAFSNTHDIPNDNIISGRHSSRYPGGVCLSMDHAATWRASNQGLPALPVTSVVVDPRSPRGSRTLYAGVFGGGVFRSNDDGKTWTACSEGLGAPSNVRVCRVALHRDGTLFALVTATRQGRRFMPEGVGLYRSTDRGAHWSLVNRTQPLLWPKDFTVDPRDSRTIYLSGCDANGEQQGGLYRTRDGGATWTKLTRQGPEHFGAYLHRSHPGWIYATLTEGAPGAGLWLSQDDGATWKPVLGMPFANAQRVVVDPADPATIYVTTFGGSVWRGPAAPAQ